MRSLAVLVAACVCSAADLSDRIREIMTAAPEAQQCFWGIRVNDAESGDEIFSLNENRFFVPASNTKLFTTSLALLRLGPDYRFRTKIEADSLPDAQGRVHELRLIGGGDPNLSARLLPYNKDETGADPLAALRAMADQVVALGVRVVGGELTGDDTAYLWEPFPDGWSVDDPVYEYGAPVSALTMNDNSFKVTVLPGASVGLPATLTLTPTLEYLTIHNRTQTVAIGPARIRYSRIPGSRDLLVSGTILLDAGEPLTAVLAIDDPALFAVEALRKLLEERGVRIEGQSRAIHRRPDEDASGWTGTEIASHESAPLSQILQVINKVSQNLHTELVLREIARVKNGVGSRSGGL
ncbi:MAG: D-alanyl-D-alanine carboxypeptidase/D-alanyl-D-alanine-endopeptidase, partial [Bryobacteraceae bacterium]|nr:D-alanyl-D-alanine carboxypeptidase/D-alanyl-D-alanine-endopeptidase [Bryobacteraceae bacterium]